ncbi:MAG: peptidoglycan DD-metalloendopeptidase family protein [Gammaproteobacteria bacterium]|nr:peptidoglycan DD-metalloendopeptidase family protein [Gammaproteobacteria bacterium]
MRVLRRILPWSKPRGIYPPIHFDNSQNFGVTPKWRLSFLPRLLVAGIIAMGLSSLAWSLTYPDERPLKDDFDFSNFVSDFFNMTMPEKPPQLIAVAGENQNIPKAEPPEMFSKAAVGETQEAADFDFERDAFFPETDAGDDFFGKAEPAEEPDPFESDFFGPDQNRTNNTSWLDITIKPGDNLSAIFEHNAFSKNDLYRILALGESVKALRRLRPGQKIRIKHTEEGRIETLIKEIDFARELRISKAASPPFTSEIRDRKLETQTRAASGIIESSLFCAGNRVGLSDTLILKMVEIFAWDIDFALDLKVGDQFKVMFEEHFFEGEKVKTGKILAAEFVNNGTVYRAVRYTDAESFSAYYAPNGESMQKAFLRTPVQLGRITSRFNLKRRHPILNKIRAHKGVDYAALTGTPVVTTGNGRVTLRGRKNGYGKTVVIRHGDKYSTLYAHLSDYAKDLKTGMRVTQGDVIGYVGQTGLATGSHLHYEFLLNNEHKNPLTVELPKALPIEAQYKQDFFKKSRPVFTELSQINVVAQATGIKN